MIERLMDLAARTLNMDPVELRKKNFIPADKFPYQTPVAFVYDSGNYGPALDKALEMVGYKKFREEQEKARKNGQYLGIGLSTYIQACGPPPPTGAGGL